MWDQMEDCQGVTELCERFQKRLLHSQVITHTLVVFPVPQQTLTDLCICFFTHPVDPPGTSMPFVPRYVGDKLAREHMRNQPSWSTSVDGSGSLPGPSSPTSSSDPPSEVGSGPQSQSRLIPVRRGEQPYTTNSSVLRYYTQSEASEPTSDQSIPLSTSPPPMRHTDAGPVPESMMGTPSLPPAYGEQISGPASRMV
ncbi:hypothetical protein GYMLUDRAFT_399305 [Collybiopsis luxurians FD-317 M1]|nr:hypothetical protein GYMLUDRAFT_399305 [Collybiopsis luxurians FD-317 M1]